MKIATVIPFLILLCAAPAVAAALPERLDPPAPFPRIALQAPVIEPVAPGVTKAQYDLITQAGPIVVHVVAIAPHRDDLRVDSVLANDVLTSGGETVSSMARRTGAVAGINADYFDIGATNRPTNIVVHGGRLLRSPRKRCSLVITRNGMPHILENDFQGQVQIGNRTATIDAINELPPPNGGLSLITPEFGPVAPIDNLTLVTMATTDGTPPFATYRVSSVADNLTQQPPGFYLAIGLNAYGSAGVPNPGDAVVATGDLSPLSTERIVAAVGGGPMILQNGGWISDPDGPNGGEYALRIPSSGAAIEPDGTLLLIEVDGRQPEYSVGVTRQEFSALMRALGADQGLAFDGGGSSEIVARPLGTTAAALQNTPSDGIERPVADGLFVYSDAPDGPATEVVSRPAAIRALLGTSVDLNLAAIDAADHALPLPNRPAATVVPASLGVFRDGAFEARSPGRGEIVFRSGDLHGRVPVAVYDTPARIAIVPARANVAENGSIKLGARAFDAQGFPITLPSGLRWNASAGVVGSDGVYRAAKGNARVSVVIGKSLASAIVSVGSHNVPIPLLQLAHFMSVPKGGEGAVVLNGDELELQYALGSGERAAYAAADIALPANTVGISFDLRDDGSGSHVRVAVRNAINEQILVTAATLERPGWRRVAVRLPQNIAEPARLSAIYVIGRNGATVANGSIAIKDVEAVVAGSR